MNAKICFVMLLFHCCSAHEQFPGNSPLSWLRKRIFGTTNNEERFVNRLATATQSLVTLMNDPVVLAELNRYYGMLLRNPDVSKIVDSVRPPSKRPSSTRLTSVAPTAMPPTTTSMSTPSATGDPELSTTLTTTTAGNTTVTTTTAGPVTSTTAGSEDASPWKHDGTSYVNTVNGIKYRFYFDPKQVSRPIDDEARARVRRHLNIVRFNDVDNCVSYLICEMSRYPLRYGSLGVKVDRFFRYPMWDTDSSAAHYAAVARHGRRYGGCRGRISSCRHPIGPLFQRHYSFRYGQ
ncbi:uncharacterized protein LOC119373744 [Rhipicephalus sanguineus]|uniref:Uncharacterized protein n=1 Tax=Rhipicephalus sanguineus TaxID=34632 RepID=A0A9D4QB64_RHISA|nr:uncharacterized protein LOC119373744 [Rhipicephalus sanguineus]KAH7972650.1 hypothetical protein HPB52_014754 [Rhipicephalus sanguineus]